MKKLLFLGFFLSLFLTHSVHAATPHYAIVIDAGSSGSRLHLFEYKKESSLPLITELFSSSIKPGLSAYENNPQEAGISLKKIMDDAAVEAQKNQIDLSTVSISIYGTAGMRLLPLEKQEAIYKNISFYLKNHYAFTLGEIRTIPGKLEGLFGWLDLNYLLHSFDSPVDITKGSIDVGGASTQIAFSSTDSSNPEDSFHLTIGGQVYTVFSKSFLGLGLVEALNQINTQPFATSCYPAHYPLSTTNKGNFHFGRCNYLYQNLINQHAVSQQLPSLAKKDFVAYTGAFYTENFFGVTPTPSKANLVQKINEICGKSWEQLVEAYPEEPEKYLSTYCANGVYLSQLLYESYQLQEKQLTVTNSIHQEELNWSLGALLYQLVKG